MLPKNMINILTQAYLLSLLTTKGEDSVTQEYIKMKN